MKKIILIFSIVAFISGCTIPRAVFKVSLINQETPEYRLVEVTHRLKKNDAEIIHDNIIDDVFKKSRWRWESLDVGDFLHVTILSSGGAGYLSDNSSSDRADFENILVSKVLTVSVPYAGNISVRNFDVNQLSDEIRKRLSRVVLNPQVLVTLTSRTAAMVTLLGGSGKTGRFPIDQSMNHLSHILAVATSENSNADMTDITITRNQQRLHMRLADIYQFPRLDISLQPDDQITIRQVAEYVNVLGAVGVQGNYLLVKRNSNVIDALALAKGMNDSLADPQAVFLFKHNEMELAKQERRKPNIYHVDMSQPDSTFRARTMTVEDGDVIYISNASLTDFSKVKAAFDAFLIRGSNTL